MKLLKALNDFVEFKSKTFVMLINIATAQKNDVNKKINIFSAVAHTYFSLTCIYMLHYFLFYAH